MLAYRAQLFDKLPNFDRYYFHFRHKTTKNCVYNKSLGNQNYLCLRWVFKSIFTTNDSDLHNISNSFNIGAFKMVEEILSFRRPIPQKMAAGWVLLCTHGVVPFWNVVFAGWYIAAASIGSVTKRQRLPLSFTQKYLTYGPELGHCKVNQAYLKKIIFVTYSSNLNFKLWTYGKTIQAYHKWYKWFGLNVALKGFQSKASWWLARIWLYFEFWPANKLIKIQIGAKSVPVNVTP